MLQALVESQGKTGNITYTADGTLRGRRCPQCQGPPRDCLPAELVPSRMTGLVLVGKRMREPRGLPKARRHGARATVPTSCMRECCVGHHCVPAFLRREEGAEDKAGGEIECGRGYRPDSAGAHLLEK